MLPPRTGKTVIAAHIAALLGVQAAFVVPTRVLVHQTRRELARHAPGIAVGVQFGEGEADRPGRGQPDDVREPRTNRSAWHPDLASSRLVFVDEAHHALTAPRRRALERAFPANAPRVALTATPDYDERRRVDLVFPHRIARLELRDAVARGLVAPTTACYQTAMSRTGSARSRSR